MCEVRGIRMLGLGLSEAAVTEHTPRRGSGKQGPGGLAERQGRETAPHPHCGGIPSLPFAPGD